MKRSYIVIFSIIIIFLTITIFMVWFFDPYTPYGTVSEIKVIISPERIEVKDYTQMIMLNIELKNIANENRKIIDYYYTHDMERITCNFKTDNSSYLLLRGQIEREKPFVRDKVLQPAESFSFNLYVPLKYAENFSSLIFLHDDKSDSCELYVALLIQDTNGISNVIQIYTAS